MKNFHYALLLPILALLFCHSTLRADTECPLPAPGSVTVTYPNLGTPVLHWTPVTGYATTYYKITLLDKTLNTYLPTQYTTNTHLALYNMPPGHIILAGVSASNCQNGPFGAEAPLEFPILTFIIIDDVVQFSCEPGSSINKLAGSSQEFTLPPASPNNGVVQATRLTVQQTGNLTNRVELALWADCNYAPHVSEIFKSRYMVRDPSGNNVVTPTVTYSISGLTTGFLMIEPGFSGAGMPSAKVNFLMASQLSHCSGQVTGNNLCSGRGDDELSERDDLEVAVSTEFYHKLRVVPNPASAFCRVEYFLPADGRAALSIADVTGKVLQTVSVPDRQEAGPHTLSVPMEHLPAGLYFFVLQTEEGRLTTKAVKE